MPESSTTLLEPAQLLSPCLEPSSLAPSDAPLASIPESAALSKGESASAVIEAARAAARAVWPRLAQLSGAYADTEVASTGSPTCIDGRQRLTVVTPVPVPEGIEPTAEDEVSSEVTTPADSEGGYFSTGSVSPPADADELARSTAGSGSESRLTSSAPSEADMQALLCQPVADEEHEDAVMALLALNRVPSTEPAAVVTALPVRPTPPSALQLLGAAPGSKRRITREPLEGEIARFSPVPKPDGSGEAKFFCKYPHCGKGYASTDAVRKHCRQRHLEWLRGLGHGCPALYCHWGETVSPN